MEDGNELNGERQILVLNDQDLENKSSDPRDRNETAGDVEEKGGRRSRKKEKKNEKKEKKEKMEKKEEKMEKN